jgi:ribose-phosphate pyrophosphokinase
LQEEEAAMLTVNEQTITGIFYTAERYALVQAQRTESPRGSLLIASCRSATPLANTLTQRYLELAEKSGARGEITHLKNIDFTFADSETCVRLDQPVSGSDVFLLQCLLDPTSDQTIDQNYMAFLIAARAFRERGANHVTAVLPYLAYSRQDKPTKFMREPTTAKLMADLAISAGIDRLVAWDPHSQPLRGFYGSLPVDLLESLTLFTEEFRRFQGREDVIVVAPDVGASKFVTYFGRALELNCAIASKSRPHAGEAVITEVIGDLARKRVAIVLDDMISSGGTVDALIKKLVLEYEIEEIYLGASHNLCLPSAHERLLDLYNHYHLKEVIVTNSIPQTNGFLELPFLSVRCLSDILSRVINRIHYNRSVSELFIKFNASN